MISWCLQQSASACFSVRRNNLEFLLSFFLHFPFFKVLKQLPKAAVMVTNFLRFKVNKWFIFPVKCFCFFARIGSKWLYFASWNILWNLCMLKTLQCSLPALKRFFFLQINKIYYCISRHHCTVVTIYVYMYIYINMCMYSCIWIYIVHKQGNWHNTTGKCLITHQELLLKLLLC